jgi:hypothetical protein
LSLAELSRTGLNLLADHVLVEPAWARECTELLADFPAYLESGAEPFALRHLRRTFRHD